MHATRILFRQMKMQIETIQNGNVAAATSTTTATTNRNDRINRMNRIFFPLFCYDFPLYDVSILYRHLIVGNFAISKTCRCFFLCVRYVLFP